MARHVVRSVAAGAIAGAAGTLAMDLVWYARFRRSGGDQPFVPWETSEGTAQYDDAAAPARTAKAVADIVGLELPDGSARMMNNIVHWATGIGWGKAQGFVAAATGITNPLLGVATAVTAWATSYAILPLLGVYKPMRQYTRDVLWQDLSAHLAYGVTMGVAYRFMAASSD
jgi:hypothetical protein